MSERPNVLLVVLDAARADAFEPYGASPGSTPAIADLAGRGAALPAMFAAGCWTIPSHASLFTGLLPRATGLARAPGGNLHRCRPVMQALRDRLLPEVLRRAGYTTGAVSTNLWLTPASGFDTGFDDFVTIDTRRQAQLGEDSLLARTRWALEGVRARVDDGADEAHDVLRSWLGRSRDRPFFWFVNLVECHSPYLPPRPYNDLGPRDRLRAATEARRHLTLDAIWRACAGGPTPKPEVLARMRHLYGRAIRRLDDWLAAVLEDLDARSELARTLVVVASDHGENFGEGGLMGHGFSLDDRLLHVPCVVAGPGAFAPLDVHGLPALPRLIAEAVGIERHPWRDGLPPSGVAVAQFDAPVAPDDPRAVEAPARLGLDRRAVERLTTSLTCATNGRTKLLVRGEVEELYDLERDPLELNPISPAETVDQASLTRLRAALRDPGAIATAPPAQLEAPVPAEPSESELRRLEERMRLLGYL